MNLLDDVPIRHPEFEVRSNGITEMCHAGVYVSEDFGYSEIPDCDDPDMPVEPYAQLAWLRRDGTVFCLARANHHVRKPA